MSESLARLAVNQLRKNMYPNLPQDVQNIFPKIADPFTLVSDPVPNIVVGEYTDFGMNAQSPVIAVHCEGPQEGIVNVWRHLKLSIDIWIGGNTGGNVDGRRIVSIIYEYVNRALQNVNWSGEPSPGADYIQIQRCFESERSSILFDTNNKAYRIANIYQVEAISKTWY